jgi:RHS repeat-associated protein
MPMTSILRRAKPMPSTDETILCHYRYDPLDRLVDCSSTAQANTQRFYLEKRLTCEIQGAIKRSIFQHDDQLLAQQQCKDGAVETTLLATDLQRSVLHLLDATGPHPHTYTPYGHLPSTSGLLSLLGFNGERPDPVTGHYLLGNGYRAFNPVLMRFNSPDSWSPFGAGGLNSYAYCAGEPVNRSDPTGHTWAWLKIALRRVGLMRPSAPGVQPAAFRDPLATTGTIPSRPQQATLPLTDREALQNVDVKTPAWTTRGTIAVHNSPSTSRRGSQSHSFEQDNVIGTPLARSRSASENSLGMEERGPFTPRERTRAAVNMDDANDPGLIALRHRYGGSLRSLHEDLPPRYENLPPRYEELAPPYSDAINQIRR